MHAYTHACMHARTHSDIRIHMHRYARTCIHTCTRPCAHQNITNMHTCIHTCNRLACARTHMHAYMHAYMYACTHAEMQPYMAARLRILIEHVRAHTHTLHATRIACTHANTHRYMTTGTHTYTPSYINYLHISHTYTHAYIHTGIATTQDIHRTQQCMHTCMHTWTHACMHKRVHHACNICMNCLHGVYIYVNAGAQACIIKTCMQGNHFTWICPPACLQQCTHACLHARMQAYMYSTMLIYMHALHICMQAYKHSYITPHHATQIIIYVHPYMHASADTCTHISHTYIHA